MVETVQSLTLRLLPRHLCLSLSQLFTDFLKRMCMKFTMLFQLETSRVCWSCKPRVRFFPFQTITKTRTSSQKETKFKLICFCLLTRSSPLTMPKQSWLWLPMWPSDLLSRVSLLSNKSRKEMLKPQFSNKLSSNLRGSSALLNPTTHL